METAENPSRYDVVSLDGGQIASDVSHETARAIADNAGQDAVILPRVDDATAERVRKELLQSYKTQTRIPVLPADSVYVPVNHLHLTRGEWERIIGWYRNSESEGYVMSEDSELAHRIACAIGYSAPDWE